MRRNLFMKKMLAILLALVMSMSLITGCKKDGENGGAEATDKMGVSLILTNTAEQIMKESKQMGKNLYGFEVNEKKVTAGLEIAADGMSIPTGVIDIESLKATLMSSVDMEKSEMTALLNGELNGTKLNLLEIVWNDEKLALASPEIMDATFTLPVKDFAEKWNASLLGESALMVEGALDDISFSKIMEAYSLSLDLQADMLLATADFLEECESEREKDTIELGGKDTDVTKIEMVVTDELTKDYLNELIDIYAELLDGFELAEELTGENLDEGIAEVREAVDEISFDDVKLNLYALDGKIAKVEYKGTIEDVDIEVYLQFNDMNKMLESMELGVNAETDGEELEFKIATSGNMTDSSDELEYKVDITGEMNDEEIVDIEVKIDYDFDDNNYVIGVDGDADGESINIKLTGKCYRSADEFKMTFDNITFSVPGEAFSLKDIIGEYLGYSANVDIAYMIYPAKKLSVTKTGKTYDILKLTEDDVAGFETELMTNVQSIASKLGISLY